MTLQQADQLDRGAQGNSEAIRYEIDGEVACITLNRPSLFNAFNREMLFDLRMAVDAARTDDNVRAVLLTGAGGAFCAGAELAEPGAEVPEPADEILRRYYNPVILSLREMPKPVVVAVNGVAVGAGMSLAMAGDILVAADSASFSCAFSRVGLAPDAGSSHFLPRAVGYHRALALMLLSPRIDADAALASGLVWRIFPAPELSSVARQIAQQLASGATQAFALTKQALLASATNALAEQLELEAALQMQAVATSDFTEGVAAFRQRRSPKFKGR